MIKIQILAHSLYIFDLLNQIKDIYEESELEIYMGHIVNTETGEVLPGQVRLHDGEYELFKLVSV